MSHLGEFKSGTAKKHAATDAQWNAILSNDPAADETFWYAVHTTHIFCRPSCQSKPPHRQHVTIFHDPKEALAAGFRPCKRCAPMDNLIPEEQWISQITSLIEQTFDQPLTIKQLAFACHSSISHLERTFKKRKGMTPMQYRQKLRLFHARKWLENSNEAIGDIGCKVGLPHTAHFITLFKKKYGISPAQYRKIWQQGRETIEKE